MKKETWYKFTFADGTVEYCRSLSKQELKTEELKHGKLLSKERESVQ